MTGNEKGEAVRANTSIACRPWCGLWTTSRELTTLQGSDMNWLLLGQRSKQDLLASLAGPLGAIISKEGVMGALC